LQREPARGDEGETCARCGARHPESAPCDAPGRTLAYGTPWPAAAPPPPGDPLIGAQVGSFRIVRMLGRGGMGTVYLAEHPAIGSRVAIKFLHESMASDPEVVGRFYDEARAVNLIGHENIVGIFDLSLLPPNRYYIVMEYLEGETLSALLARGRPAPRTAIEILLQLCDALQAAHARGVVHRDLKPENVLLAERDPGSTATGTSAHGYGTPKITDFGLAKRLDREGTASPTGAVRTS